MKVRLIRAGGEGREVGKRGGGRKSFGTGSREKNDKSPSVADKRHHHHHDVASVLNTATSCSTRFLARFLDVMLLSVLNTALLKVKVLKGYQATTALVTT